MPVVELDLGGGQTTRVETDDTSPEAIDSIAAHLRGAPSGTADNPASETGVLPTPGMDVSVGGTLKRTLKPLTDTLTDTLTDVGNAASEVLASGVPTSQRISDVATLAGPVITPELTAVQIGTEAAARGAGVSPPTAKAIGQGAAAIGGAAQMVRGGVGAVRAYQASRAARAAAAAGEATEGVEAATAAGKATQQEAAGATREALSTSTPEQ